MTVTRTRLPEVLLIQPRIFRDPRGHFLETYQRRRYHELGLPEAFVQDNLSCSGQSVLRGLHYQLGRPQGKLVMAVAGTIFDVAVDIRRGSPRFGQWVGLELSAESCRQLFVPAGFAHGFSVLSQTASVLYKCTDYYCPPDERGLRWDDPRLAIEWPHNRPILSDKDRAYPVLDETAPENLPLYPGEPVK